MDKSRINPTSEHMITPDKSILSRRWDVGPLESTSIGVEMVGLGSSEPAKTRRLVSAPSRAPLGVAAALNGSFHRITVHAAGVLRATGSEGDLISAQPAIGDGSGHVARLQCAREHLKGLLERQLSLRQLPRASYFGRNDPEKGCAVGDAF